MCIGDWGSCHGRGYWLLKLAFSFCVGFCQVSHYFLAKQLGSGRRMSCCHLRITQELMDSCPHNEKCSLPTTFLPLGHKTRRKADTKEVKSNPGLLSE